MLHFSSQFRMYIIAVILGRVPYRSLVDSMTCRKSAILLSMSSMHAFDHAFSRISRHRSFRSKVLFERLWWSVFDDMWLPCTVLTSFCEHPDICSSDTLTATAPNIPVFLFLFQGYSDQMLSPHLSPPYVCLSRCI